MQYKIKIRDFLNLLEGHIITEGRSWTEKGINVRIDSPNGYEGQQKHIHVGNFAWNQDGSRSHTGSWPNYEPTNRVKLIAAKGLGIDMNMLESYLDSDEILIVEPDDISLQPILESMNVFLE